MTAESRPAVGFPGVLVPPAVGAAVVPPEVELEARHVNFLRMRPLPPTDRALVGAAPMYSVCWGYSGCRPPCPGSRGLDDDLGELR